VELHVASSDDRSEVSTDLRDSFLVQHAAICAEKEYANPFEASESARFLEELFNAGLNGGWAFYGRLRVDGETVAWILGLLHDREFYWWRPAYHPDWKSLSPGKVLLALMLEHGLESRWKKIHFHGGMQRYKLAWKPDLPSMAQVTWYSPSVRSSGLRYYDRLVGSS
jgi:CelD/BcsL family acetyltransferase involved in cellulose biosynthesis